MGIPNVLPVPERLANNNAPIITRTAADLIRLATEHPPEPIIANLLYCDDVLLLHGREESFKSAFTVQMAETIAAGHKFLGFWEVPRPRTVGVIETEMHETQLGVRLGKMFGNGNPPDRLSFLADESLRPWRRADMDGKFSIIERWVEDEGIEVLMIDTANDFFRGNDDASVERTAGKFFDSLRNLDVKARMVVRHDRKLRSDELPGTNPNERIRGSGEWKEDPECILSVQRADGRTHEVAFEVGKLRYADKPEPFSLWFDSRLFRLTPLPPLISILGQGQKTRQQVLEDMKSRFGLEQRKADELLTKARGEVCVRQGQQGHNRTYELIWEGCREQGWFKFVPPEWHEG